jgi:methyl-accepting chemotaxis protein
MNSQSWILIMIVGFFIMALGFIAAIGFLVYASLEIRRAAQTFKEFLKNTEERINSVLEETEQTLKSIRKVSDDMGTATENVRNFSGAMHEIVDNVRALSSIVHDVREGMSLRVLGVKAGIKTALNVLLKELMSK